ncbi:MAG TPA: DNA repair protein RadC [bacterium]|nr:DNA repair protein RadC [bacterium]
MAHEPSIRAWPQAERPRERLQALGARQLSDSELLALMLGSGTRRAPAMVLARQLQVLAQSRGGFSQLELADVKSLCGLGLAKAAALLAAMEWGRRQALRPPAEALAGPQAVVEALKPLLSGRREEHIAVLALDARRRILAAQLISQGCLTSAMAHPREVFRAAVKLGAAAIVVGHNHPSGDPRPSPEDHALTRRLREAAEVLGIPLLDHVIVGEGRAFSYAECAWPV